MPLAPISIIRKRADFMRAKAGRKLRSPHVHIQCIASPEGTEQPSVRVGYTVSKHCGNAVIRNKIKRRLRHIMRDLLPEMGVVGHDYVVIAREGCDKVVFADLRAALTKMLQKAQSS